MLDYLTVGYVLRPRGIKGEVKIEPLTDNMEQFEAWKTLYIEGAEGYLPLEIKAKRYIKNHVYLYFHGYDNTDKAEKLRGKYLWIPKKLLGDLPDDSFFVADIIGCSIFTGQGQNLGIVDRVLHTGSNDVYVSKNLNKEILIPALKKTVLDVDIQAKKIIVDAHELKGLLPDED